MMVAEETTWKQGARRGIMDTTTSIVNLVISLRNELPLVLGNVAIITIKTKNHC